MTEKLEKLLDINQNYLHHVNISSPSAVIDLTEDDEDERPPPIKKVVIRNNGHGEYSTINRPEDQPGPSGFNEVQRKDPHGQCITCQMRSTTINLECNHQMCYHCFNYMLQNSKTAIDKCPQTLCNHEIADGEIEKFLLHDDYVSFLEHSRDFLRKELKLQALEISFLGLNQSNSQQCNSQDDIIDIQDLGPASQPHSTPKIRRRRSELIHLQNLDNMSYVKNTFEFECPICLIEIEIGDGVILKNCLHSLCIDCFQNHVKMCDDPEVICPYNSAEGSCEFMIQEREIRAIVPLEIYEIHIGKGMKRAETVLENIYHCKTPDCVGFFQHGEDRSAFVCTICDKVNCIKCKTIHEVMMSDV